MSEISETYERLTRMQVLRDSHMPENWYLPRFPVLTRMRSQKEWHGEKRSSARHGRFLTFLWIQKMWDAATRPM